MRHLLLMVAVVLVASGCQREPRTSFRLTLKDGRALDGEIFSDATTAALVIARFDSIQALAPAEEACSEFQGVAYFDSPAFQDCVAKLGDYAFVLDAKLTPDGALWYRDTRFINPIGAPARAMARLTRKDGSEDPIRITGNSDAAVERTRRFLDGIAGARKIDWSWRSLLTVRARQGEHRGKPYLDFTVEVPPP